MRLFLTLLCLAVILLCVARPSAPSFASSSVDTSAEEFSWKLLVQRQTNPDVRFLLTAVEHARIIRNTDECSALGPVPLYDDAPSPNDWMNYCLARVQRNVARCDDIAATIVPDLHLACQQELSFVR